MVSSLGLINRATAAQQAGLSGTALTTAVAISAAEDTAEDPTSSVINDDAATGDYSVGWWQINYYGSLYDSRAAAFGPPSAVQNPTGNAKAMYSISSGGRDFTPWSTYKSGAYLANLDAAQTAVNSIGAPGTGATTGTGSGIFNDIIANSPTTGTTDTTNTCLFSLPVVGCVISQNTGRKILGGLLIGAGGLLAIVGIGLLLNKSISRTVAPSAPSDDEITEQQGDQQGRKAVNRHTTERSYDPGKTALDDEGEEAF